MHLRITSLVSGGVLALPLLGHMEAEVLQQDDGAGGWVGAGGLHLSTDTVLQEGDVPAGVQSACGEDVLLLLLLRLKALCFQSIASPSQQALQLSGNGFQREFLWHKVPVGTSQVAHQNNRFGPVVQAVLDGGNSRLDSEKENHQDRFYITH